VSWKSDLLVLGVAGVGLYYVVTKIFPDVAGGIQKTAGDIGVTVYESGADFGEWLKYLLSGNLPNIMSPVKAPPSQETIELEAQAGFYYDPITKGFLPVGYTWEKPEDPFHSKLIPIPSTSTLTAEQQAAGIAAAQTYYAGGPSPSLPGMNLGMSIGEITPITSPFAAEILNYSIGSNIISGMGYINPITRQVIPAPDPSQQYAETHYYDPIAQTFKAI